MNDFKISNSFKIDSEKKKNIGKKKKEKTDFALQSVVEENNLFCYFLPFAVSLVTAALL